MKILYLPNEYSQQRQEVQMRKICINAGCENLQILTLIALGVIVVALLCGNVIAGAIGFLYVLISTPLGFWYHNKFSKPTDIEEM